MDFFDFREPISTWTHFSWLLLSIPGTWLLWRRSRGDHQKQACFLIYGLSLALCLASSALFHGVRASAAWIEGFNRLDHIAIYVLIAGTYTPITWFLMKGWPKWAVLIVAWSFAAAGGVWISTQGILPPRLSTALYLTMGWGALYCYVEMARFLSHRTLFPLILGGLLYSIGALLNVLHWPVVAPGAFEAHELFHVFVMGGSLAHFWFMLVNVVPIDRVGERPLQRPAHAPVPSRPHIPVLPGRIAGWRVHFLWIPARDRQPSENHRVPPLW